MKLCVVYAKGGFMGWDDGFASAWVQAEQQKECRQGGGLWIPNGEPGNFMSFQIRLMK